MRTKQIQKEICKREVLKGNIPCENVSNLLMGSWEGDVYSILRSGYLAEYEVKTSRSDFKADAKKRKWEFFDLDIISYMPNYFYYVCPTGLIDVSEVQKFAGLVYVDKSSFQIVKKAKILHRRKHDLLKLLTKFCRVKSERKYLGSCLLTYKNNQLKERNRKIIMSSDTY